MNKLRGLGVAAVFLAGCAVGGASSRLIVPQASAQQAAALTKWEYSCVDLDNDDTTQTANKMGAQGWDMIGAAETSGRNENFWCFKRPKM